MTIEPHEVETEEDEAPASGLQPVPIPEEELVPEDDAIIGRALRRSLLVAGAVALLAVAVYLALHRRQEAAPEVSIAAAPPLAARVGAEAPQVRFTDVTAEAGIDFVHFNGATGHKLLPETMGGGAAFFDYDGDGYPDLLLVSGSDWPGEARQQRGPTLVLYRNLGGRFVDVTAGSGLGDGFYGQGVAAGDFDGDGRVDLFVTAVGANRLYRNLGGGRFEDVTAAAGVAGAADEWSTGAAFFDYDGDGDLDLFVCNYVRWSKEIDFQLDYRLTGIGRAYGPPLNYQGTYPYLYRNEGDGTFTEVSQAAGLHIDNPATGVPVAKSLAVAPIDVDGDGWIDLMVANDTVRNFFFRNRGDGTFEETAEFFGLAYDRDGSATGAMGIDAAAYRNDGDVGFAIGNFANEMTSLFVSQGDPTLFADEAITEGIGAPTRIALSFGLLLFDYDLDGRLDLAQANGHLEEEITKVDPSQQYRQPTQLFWNSGGAAGGRTFVEVAAAQAGDLARPLVGRGSAVADYDLDGDLDLLVVQNGGPPLLLRNDQQLGHHWLRVRLVGGGNRDAIGAWVELTAGDVTQRRQVMPTRSYLSQSELPLTFGLGAATAIDALTVTWPDGSVQPVAVEGVDQLVVVEKSAGA
ncbi:MAG TPA: CRTAC1 family protein [Thermoanaerobaculia bacterium]|nr:CRTAC1 family protein [Thermoanaerobaculia bacterium]